MAPNITSASWESTSNDGNTRVSTPPFDFTNDTSVGLETGVAQAILVVYAAFLLMINIFLNGLLMFTVLYINRKKRIKPSHVIVLGLSLSDLSMALLYLPLVLVILLQGSQANCQVLCRALSVLERGLVPASIWGAALVSFDRYLYIVRHHKYQSRMNLRNSAGGLVTVWVIGFAFGATSWFLAAHSTSPSGACLCHLTLDFYGIYHLLYSAVYITLSFILPTTLILVFYGFIIRVAYKRVSKKEKNPFRMPSSRVGSMDTISDVSNLSMPNNAICNLNTMLPLDNSRHTKRLYQVKTARIIFLVLSLYIVCVTPYFAINVIVSSGHWVATGFPQTIYLASTLILNTYSSCNPLFYGFANRRLRSSLKNYLRSKVTHTNTIEHRLRKRRNSKLSVMGDSCSVSGHRGSVCSDISALSAMSRDALVNHDLHEAYNHYFKSTQDEHALEIDITHATSDHTQNDGVVSRFKRNTRSGDEMVRPNSADEKSFICNANTTADESAHCSSHSLSSPIRKPLFDQESKRSLALKKITTAALVFSTYKEELEQHKHQKRLSSIGSPPAETSQECSSSPSTEYRISSPRSPNTAWELRW